MAIKPPLPKKIVPAFVGAWFCFSNFYPVDIKYEKRNYPSVEHAFQAAKTLDNRSRSKIARTESPAMAKKIGRQVVFRDDWEDVKIGIMYDLLKLKAAACDIFREKLRLSGEAELIEGNWWHDIFWGKCNGIGHNHLGKLLMKLRDELRER